MRALYLTLVAISAVWFVMCALELTVHVMKGRWDGVAFFALQMVAISVIAVLCYLRSKDARYI